MLLPFIVVDFALSHPPCPLRVYPVCWGECRMERASVAADAHAAWAGGAALSCLPLFPIAIDKGIDLSFMPDAAELVTHGSCHCPRHEVVASEGVSCDGTGSAPHERRDEGKGEQSLPHVTRHTFRTQLEGSSEIASFVVMSMQRSVAASCASVRELWCSCPSSWWISRCRHGAGGPGFHRVGC